MWMVNPSIFCRQHLMGQHVEFHMFLGSLKRKINIDGYIQSNCIEILALNSYHDFCVQEMLRRNYNHRTPLPPISQDILSYYSNYLSIKVDQQASLHMLLSRCQECKSNYERLLNSPSLKS
jgi:hypothetical protein